MFGYLQEGSCLWSIMASVSDEESGNNSGLWGIARRTSKRNSKKKSRSTSDIRKSPLARSKYSFIHFVTNLEFLTTKRPKGSQRVCFENSFIPLGFYYLD